MYCMKGKHFIDMCSLQLVLMGVVLCAAPPPDDLGSGYESDRESDGDSNMDVASSSTEDILDKFLEDIDKESMKVTTEMIEEPEQINEKLKEMKLQSEHSVVSATNEVKGLEETKEEEKEIEVVRNEGNAKQDISEESIHGQASGYSQIPVCEVEDGWLHVSVLKEVPSLSSLCMSVFHKHLEVNGKHNIDSRGLRDVPPSSSDSDRFDHFQSPWAPPASNKSISGVNIKSTVEDEDNKPSPTFTVALISRRSRHRAGDG